MAETQQIPKVDPTETARLYAGIAQKSGALITKMLAKGMTNPQQALEDELGIAKAFFDAWVKMLSDPVQLAQVQMKLRQDYATLWQNMVMAMSGQKPVPVA